MHALWAPVSLHGGRRDNVVVLRAGLRGRRQQGLSGRCCGGSICASVERHGRRRSGEAGPDPGDVPASPVAGVAPAFVIAAYRLEYPPALGYSPPAEDGLRHGSGGGRTRVALGGGAVGRGCRWAGGAPPRAARSPRRQSDAGPAGQRPSRPEAAGALVAEPDPQVDGVHPDAEPHGDDQPSPPERGADGEAHQQADDEDEHAESGSRAREQLPVRLRHRAVASFGAIHDPGEPVPPSLQTPRRILPAARGVPLDRPGRTHPRVGCVPVASGETACASVGRAYIGWLPRGEPGNTHPVPNTG